MEKKAYVYDIETFVNFFSFIATDKDSLDTKTFVIWKDQNDLAKMVKFLREECKSLIGFNNLRFDYPIIHHLLVQFPKIKDLDSDSLTDIIYKKAQQVINEDWPDIPYWKEIVPQVDLYRIWHFDNWSKSASLKDVQIAMDWKKVQDMPIGHASEIENIDQVSEILEYNLNDVLSTRQFLLIGDEHQNEFLGFNSSLKRIALRQKLSKDYGLYLINYSNTKMGAEVILRYMSNALNLPMKVIKKKSTFRKTVKFEECILPYIDFESDQLKDMLNYLKSIEIDALKTKNIINHPFTYKDFKYKLGTGGLHGATNPGVYKSDDEFQIVDVDVTSYYPNIAIRNGLYPKHMSRTFIEIYEKVYDLRLEAKKRGDKVISDGLKEALNSIFGLSGYRGSPFYDVKFFLSFTLNGQLLLIMLSEKIINNIEGSEMIQANTDGITLKVPRNKMQDFDNVCLWWEGLTKLNLEKENYKQVVIRDVNNYFCEYENGEFKYKGAFGLKRDMNENHSQRIVRKAVIDYFVNGTPIEGTIKSEKNILLFCKRAKARAGAEVHWGFESLENRGQRQQKINRYFVSKSGKKLVKILPPLKKKQKEILTEVELHQRKAPNQTNIFNIIEDEFVVLPPEEEPLERVISVERHHLCKILNNYDDNVAFSEYDVDYDYYINEANKIVKSVEGEGDDI